MRFPEISQRPGTEGRGEVTPQEVPVQLDRLRPQPRPLLDPAGGVVAEKDTPGVRVDPLALDDLSFGQREPAFGAGLGVERVRRRPVDAIWSPVTSLLLTGRQLADRPNRRLPGIRPPADEPMSPARRAWTR
jgi:hypothetical protein